MQLGVSRRLALPRLVRRGVAAHPRGLGPGPDRVRRAAMRRQLGRGRAAFDQYEQLARGCEQYEQVVHALMQGEGADLDQRFRFSSTASTSQATRSRIGSVIELPGELNGEQHRLSLVDEEAEGRDRLQSLAKRVEKRVVGR